MFGFIVCVTSRKSPEIQGGLQVFLPLLLHSVAWNMDVMADALAAISDNEPEGHNLDVAGW